MMANKLYLVWSPCKTECVGFIDKHDAITAATGADGTIGNSVLAESFRDIFDESNLFVMTDIDIDKVD